MGCRPGAPWKHPAKLRRSCVDGAWLSGIYPAVIEAPVQHRCFSALALLLLSLVFTFASSTARAAGDPASTAEAGAPSAAGLPELPRLAPLTFPEPDPGALKELDRLLERITAEDERTRANARTALSEVTSAFVPAIRHRVQDIRTSLDRVEAPRIIESVRKSGRKSLKTKSEERTVKDEKGKDRKPKAADKAKKDEDENDGDWFDFLLAAPRPKDKTWKDVLHLIAMERMLVAIGTTPAVRELINFHSYFGELLRIDLQRQIAKLKDKAVPALIEARQHDAKIVQKWANKQLDALGRAIPGETVASNDTAILADVLRAYGRTRDVDAMRVILSFANSDRIQLREASREAVAAMGEAGLWQLRDQYLSLTGNKPPREWAWDRIARELFGLYDRARLAEVYKLMDEGVAAANTGKLLEAIDAFDKVLARAPLFERRKEMVKIYAERAAQLEAEHPDEALVMRRKALRLDPKGETAKKLEAEIAYLEGVLSITRGTPDKTAFEKTLSLEPTHERARRALADIESKAVERQSQVPRQIAAGTIGIFALLGLVLLAWRRPASGAPSQTPAPAPKDPSADKTGAKDPSREIPPSVEHD